MGYRDQFDRVLRKLYRLTGKRKDIPVVHAWEFRRIAYDVAVGMKWDRKYDKPFVEHAPNGVQQEALNLLKEMEDNPDKILEYYEESYDYRPQMTRHPHPKRVARAREDEG